ncbi:MAG: T9SS type A sorting domain-containing protein [bacterium]
MKKQILIIVILFLCFVGLKAQDNIFNIIPAGGEILVNEDTTVVSWVNTSTFTEFDVLLWDGTSCSWTTLAESIESSTYTWAIDLEGFGDMFRIKVQNSSDEEDYCFSTAYFSVIEPPEQFTNVDDKPIAESPELRLYPNPANNSLNIELQNQKIKAVYFWEMSGKLMFYLRNLNSHHCKTSLSELPNGEYYVECYSEGNQRFVRKLLISR